MALTKPPAANDLVLTIDKKFVPYLQEWYQDFKKPGDTPEKFLVRFLKCKGKTPYVLDYLKQKEAIASSITSNTMGDAFSEARTINLALESEVKTIADDMENI